MDQHASVTASPPTRQHRLEVSAEQRFGSGFAMDAALDVGIAAGAMLVVFGPSGAGKTTLLRLVAGLERPRRGRVAFDGDVWCDTANRLWWPPQRRRVGVVFQEPTLFPHLTVAENIRYGVASAGNSFERVPGLLGVERLEQRYPGELSGGEAQRVALARALAAGPRLLLLDEPFASLDAPTRVRLRRDVRALLQTTGTPSVLVTHDRTEAIAMGDLLAVVVAGRVRQLGAIADVFSRPADVEVAAALGVESVLPARVVDVSAGIVEVAVEDTVLHVAERDPIAPGTMVYACIRAEDVTLEKRVAGEGSARNHLAARVVHITAEGPIERVSLDCGFQLDALITRRSRQEMELAPGVRVTAAVKATSVHLVPRV
jgi:molybdate transport system ATP-binding protein